ncbi:MAG: serine/threonine protein kinase [Myxococcales bacterium]|nr:serine/threonine protein kinase [Myxococcales bacterium]
MQRELEQQGLVEGEVVGPYALVRVLGAGAFGAVYEAIQRPLGKRVALKVMHANVAANRDAVHRFRREAEAMVRLRHPHAVEVLDLGTARGRPYLVMEYLEGQTLAARLAGRHRLSLSAVADWMVPICSAAAAAHRLGIVHRDIKPDNIFIARGLGGDHPKLLDFGIARVAIADESFAGTASSAVLGTPFYMAPEQVVGSAAVGPRSDLWALTVVLWECLLGERLFKAATLYELFQQIVSVPIGDPRLRRPELPEALAGVMLQALVRDPARRLASVDLLGEALLRLASPRVGAAFEGVFQVVPRVADTLLGGPEVPTPTLVSTMRGSAVELPARAQSRRGAHAAWAGLAVVAAVGSALALRPGRERAGRDARLSDAVAAVAASPVSVRRRLAVHVLTEPAGAQIRLDGVPVGVGAYRGEVDADHPHRLDISAPGYAPRAVSFLGRPPPRTVALDALVAPPVATASTAPLLPQPAAAARAAAGPRRPRRSPQAAPLDARPPTVFAAPIEAPPAAPTPVISQPPPVTSQPTSTARSGGLNAGEFK